MEDKVIRVGSRKSELALIQTRIVLDLLREQHPDLKFDIVTMMTTGDRILDSALSKIGGKSFYTRELDDILLAREVDFCVYSLKDMPTDTPTGLVIGAVPRRENPHDAVVMHPSLSGRTLDDLPEGSVIGTSALRRAAQLRRRYPHLEVKDICGNLNMRFCKLSQEGSVYAAIILAVAGLERMNWHHLISSVLTPDECMYAVGQGALAAVCRADDHATLALLGGLQDVDSAICCVAERSFLQTLEGGCSVPVSVFTELTGSKLLIKGGVFDLCGQEEVKMEMSADLCHADQPDHARMRDAPDSYVGIVCHSAPSATGFQAARKLGRDLAVAMTAAGAGDILRAAKQATRDEIVANHAKRKPEGSAPVGSLPSDKMMNIGEGENSYRQCGSQSPT